MLRSGLVNKTIARSAHALTATLQIDTGKFVGEQKKVVTAGQVRVHAHEAKPWLLIPYAFRLDRFE